MDLEQTIIDYEESHQNKQNILIHIVCVPIIILTIIGILNSIVPLAGYGIPLLFLVHYSVFARQYLVPAVFIFIAILVHHEP